MDADWHISEAHKIWAPFVNSGLIVKTLQLELDFYKKLFEYSQTGDSYCFVFDFQKSEIQFLGKEMDRILGWDSDTSSYPFMIDKIHPEDVGAALGFQNQVVEFFTKLPIDKLLKYKIRFDMRVRKADGSYIRILQQGFVMAHDENGMIVQLFNIHTDITYLKPVGKPMLSFIGLGGEPSYVDVGETVTFPESKRSLSIREREILYLLMNGKLSKEVAVELNISKHTIDTHRKNMLHKNGVATIGQLIGKAVKEGWI